jgi:prophage tail gpP-like protein
MFKVLLDGKDFDRWTSLSFNRAIDNNCGQFSIEASDKNPKDSPLQANGLIEIFWNSQRCFTGWVDEVDVSGNRDNGSIIKYSGRDTLCDAYDSSMPDKGKNKKGEYTLKSACEEALKLLGMTNKVIDTTRDGIGSKKVKQQKTENGSKVLESLAKMAAKLQVWLVANEAGDLEIMRAGERVNDCNLYYLFKGDGKNNVLDAGLKIDLKEIYSKIKVRGKGSVTFNVTNKDAADLVDINGSHFDENARPTRYLEVKANDTMTKAQVGQRAKDEVNLRRAKAFVYQVKTNFFTGKDGKIIRLGGTHIIEDEQRQVSGKYLLRGFDVQFARDGGTDVTMTFAPPEAFQVVEVDERQEKCDKSKKHIKKQTKRFEE